MEIVDFYYVEFQNQKLESVKILVKASNSF